MFELNDVTSTYRVTDGLVATDLAKVLNALPENFNIEAIKYDANDGELKISAWDASV